MNILPMGISSVSWPKPFPPRPKRDWNLPKRWRGLTVSDIRTCPTPYALDALAQPSKKNGESSYRVWDHLSKQLPFPLCGTLTRYSHIGSWHRYAHGHKPRLTSRHSPRVRSNLLNPILLETLTAGTLPWGTPPPLLTAKPSHALRALLLILQRYEEKSTISLFYTFFID